MLNTGAFSKTPLASANILSFESTLGVFRARSRMAFACESFGEMLWAESLWLMSCSTMVRNLRMTSWMMVSFLVGGVGAGFEIGILCSWGGGLEGSDEEDDDEGYRVGS